MPLLNNTSMVQRLKPKMPAPTGLSSRPPVDMNGNMQSKFMTRTAGNQGQTTDIPQPDFPIGKGATPYDSNATSSTNDPIWKQYIDAYRQGGGFLNGGINGMVDLWKGKNAERPIVKLIDTARNEGLIAARNEIQKKNQTDYDRYKNNPEDLINWMTTGGNQAIVNDYNNNGSFLRDMTALNPNNPYLTNQVRSKIGSMGADAVDKDGKPLRPDVLQKKASEWETYGPYGKEGSAIDARVKDNLGDMATNDYAGTQAENFRTFKKTITDDKTNLENAAEANMLQGLSGQLTDPNNAVFQARTAINNKAAEDGLRRLRETAGAARGIGGGRLAKSVQDFETDLANQNMAINAELQKQQADQVPSYITQQRGLNNDLTKTAVGMVGGLDQTKLAANQNLMSNLNNQANLGLAQNNQLMTNQMNRYGMDKDQLAAMMGQNQWEVGTDLAERQGNANLMNTLGQNTVNNQMDLLNTYQSQDAADKAEPGRLQKILTGGANVFDWAARLGWEPGYFKEKLLGR